ncbi:hypothetical protein [Burkholderia ubonensis]|nr:hypothetical protein [Burkholderia ubonensis]
MSEMVNEWQDIFGSLLNERMLTLTILAALWKTKKHSNGRGTDAVHF